MHIAIEEKITSKTKVTLFAGAALLFTTIAAVIAFFPQIQNPGKISNTTVNNSMAGLARTDYPVILNKGAQETVPGLLTIKFSEESGISSKDQADQFIRRKFQQWSDLSKYPIESIQPLFYVDSKQKNYDLKRSLGMDRFFQISLALKPDAQSVINSLKEDQTLSNVEPVYQVKATLAPNDPIFGGEWHHQQSGDHDMDSTEAWDITTGSSEVTIAILDTGLDYTHLDMANNVWQNLGEDVDGDGAVFLLDSQTEQWVFDDGDFNTIDDDGNGKIDDFIGWDFLGNDNVIRGEGTGYSNTHGTLTAGAAAPTTNNTRDVAGVCWQCRIMGLRMTDNASNGVLPPAIEYAVDNGADVINLSIETPFSSAFEAAILYAYNQNVSVVVSAGNANAPVSNNSLPAFPQVIAVGASNDADYRIDSFWGSNWGSRVDVLAPGDGIYTLRVGGGETWAAGTSMSAPLVAGVVGLVKSRHPEFTSEQIIALIKSSVDPIVSNVYGGTGRINARKAVLYDTVPLARISESVYDRTYMIGQDVTVSGTAAGVDFNSYVLEYGNGPYPSAWHQIAQSNQSITDGNLGTLETDGLVTGNYTVRLSVTDTHGSTVFDMANFTYQKERLADFGASVRTAPMLYDVDVDGKDEIIVGAGGYVHIINEDGNEIAGWPQLATSGSSVDSTPAVGDIDGDGQLEVAAGTYSSTFFVWNIDGTVVPGWPKTLGGPVASSPAFGDIDQDGQMEIVVGSHDRKVYAWNSDGTNVSGWPKATGGYVFASPALGDLDGDGQLEVVIGSDDSKMYVWNGDGSNVAGWPKNVGYQITGSPVLADIDADSQLEIVSGAKVNRLFAWNGDSTAVPGWPLVTDTRVETSPAIADVNNDGLLEIIAGSIGKRVYIWTGDGALLTGWPQTTEGDIENAPTAVDIDDDGRIEICVTMDFPSKTMCWNDDGTALDGWPKAMSGGDPKGPAIGDINDDGYLDLLAGSGYYLYSWPTGAQIDTLHYDWPLFRHDVLHTGRYAKNCTDSLNNTCAAQKPYYCQEGERIKLCTVCGCLQRFTCQSDDTCRIKLEWTYE